MLYRLDIAIEFETKNGSCKMGSCESIYTSNNYIDKEYVIKYVNQKLSEYKEFSNIAKENITIKTQLIEENLKGADFFYGKYNEENGFTEN